MHIHVKKIIATIYKIFLGGGEGELVYKIIICLCVVNIPNAQMYNSIHLGLAYPMQAMLFSHINEHKLKQIIAYSKKLMMCCAYLVVFKLLYHSPRNI